MRVAYLGNFSVPYCTEVHVAYSLEALGHQVQRFQEGKVAAYTLPRMMRDRYRPDMFLWTQTQSLADRGGTRGERQAMLDELKAEGIPTVGFHLDRWWGLSREGRIKREPFFRVDHLFTADGGNDSRWIEEGINHHWSPPAVFHGEAVDVQPVLNYESDVAFVGAWREYGHKEWWPYRQEMLARVEARYGKNFMKQPQHEAVRGLELNHLYASVKVAVGDSCLAGTTSRYWSDRVPETLGRGGFIIHPEVEGLLDVHPDLPTYPLGDFDELIRQIDFYLNHQDIRNELRLKLASDVRMNHTYADRMETLIETVLG